MAFTNRAQVNFVSLLEFTNCKLFSSLFYKIICLFFKPVFIFIVGDCNTSRPGMMDFKGKAKWNGWNAKKGLSQEDAKTQYIALAQKLLEKHGSS